MANTKDTNIMYNVFFEDTDLNLQTKVYSFLKKDQYGYFIELSIRKSDVLKLMRVDVIPKHTEDDIFILKVRINNNTTVTLNGIKVTFFDDERLKNLPLKELELRELILKRYSKYRKNPAGYCYATKAVFKINMAKFPKRKVSR